MNMQKIILYLLIGCLILATLEVVKSGFTGNIQKGIVGVINVWLALFGVRQILFNK